MTEEVAVHVLADTATSSTVLPTGLTYANVIFIPLSHGRNKVHRCKQLEYRASEELSLVWGENLGS